MAVRSGVQASIQVDGEGYRVLRYVLREQLSEVSSLACTIAKDDHDPPDPASLVDKPAVLHLESNDHTHKRTFVGKVVSARRRNEGHDTQVVDLRIAPDAWRMSRRADCRIFQQKTVVDIVKEVLQGAGVDHSEWKTTGSYPERDYTVQYRETDLEFVARLLSEEGIYFAIEHADADTVVFGDDPKGFCDVAGATSLTFRKSFGERETGEHVYDVARAQQVRSDKTTLRDYDPTKPKVKLESTAKTDKGELEVYVWPGRFTKPSEGDRLAKVLLDSLRVDGDVVTGQAGVLTLVPGRRFSIADHPYEPMNQEYLVVGVDIHGQDDRFFASHAAAPVERAAGMAQDHSYACTFHAVPTGVSPYRPPRILRERVVPGTQTAVTTGPAGEEIHTDANAQVKVQLHWDRLGKNDEHTSRWMRSSQLPVGGAMLLPRMKWEVTIRYLDGDVDQPVVMARMTNAANPPPYALPEHKGMSSIQTATTPGGGSSNEIRMSDAKGSEEMMMNASKDMSVSVGNNTTESIGANLTRQIGANHKLNVTDSFSGSVGASQTVSVGAQQQISVQTFMVDQVAGNHSLTVGGARSMKVGGDHKRDVTGDSTLEVGGMSIDLVVGAANESALGNYAHKVGAALVEMTAGGRSFIVAGDRSETATLAKIIVTAAGRAVDVSGSMNQKVAGAVIRKVTKDLSETSGAGFTEVASGAQILKATNIQIEGETMVTIAMGASTIVLMPAMVTIAGVSMKVDGQLADSGALVLDN